MQKSRGKFAEIFVLAGVKNVFGYDGHHCEDAHLERETIIRLVQDDQFAQMRVAAVASSSPPLLRAAESVKTNDEWTIFALPMLCRSLASRFL